MEINILGYGVMGRQISSVLILSGYKVNILSRKDIPEDKIKRNVKIISRLLSLEIKSLVFELYTDINDLPNNLTIECIDENLDKKIEIYENISKKNDKPYITNTSSFSPSEINKNISGIHFFNPITIKLIEVYLTKEHTSSKEVAALIGLFNKIGFDVVNVKNNRAYIANYILFEEISTAIKLIEKYNYSMSAILGVYKHLYGGRNIFDIVDLVGIDITYNILNNLNESDESVYVPKLLKEALSNGYLGKKNKKTFKSFLEYKEKM